ncbi:MAG: GDSL-type esterase/lipase family protein [Deltaproteobacteria bacterium]
MTEPTQPPAPPGHKRLPPLVWRLIGLGVLGLAAIGSAWFYRYLWYARPVGKGPAGPAVPAERFADDRSTWSDRTVLLLGIGDSVTAGFGVSPGTGYFDRLVANPQNEFPDMEGKCLSKVLPNLIQRNLAEHGSSSLGCLERQIAKIDVQDEDTFGVIVLTIGGNDIIHDYGRDPPREGAMYGATLEQAIPWIESFRTRLDTIIDQIETKFPGGCEFFIANVYDPTDGVGDTENAGLPRWPDGLRILEMYNTIIAAAAEKRKNAELVDVHGLFLGHGIHCLKFWQPHYDARDPHYWYGENLEDPNDRGCDALRRLFLKEMTRVLPPLLEDGD